MKKLYVGNLAYSITSQDLTDLFAKHGEVKSANIIKDKYSGTSKGFAFVEMAQNEDADKAIQELNGTEIEGRALKVNEAMDTGGGAPRGNNRDRFEKRN